MFPRTLLPAVACWVAFLARAVLAAEVAPAPDAFIPFPVDWNAPADSPVSVAGLLDRPAGKDGFVAVANGHLVRGAGENAVRLRIWGVNMTAKACFPAKEHAPRLADHLARVGINCVRFHFLDRTAPNGLIDATRNDTAAFDANQLDKLDFFVAELKKRGIYTNLNLNVGRTYKAGDGVRDHEIIGFAKAMTYFNPRLLELQRQYARDLLTHKNPYTGNEYRHEPAVALVELVNENSIVEAWFSGRLLGKHTTRNPGTWADIPASYEQELTALFNAWLAKNAPAEQVAAWKAEAKVGAGDPLPRLRPDQFGKASPERFRTEARFYMGLERDYFDSMAKLIKEEIGARMPVLATSDHNHGKSGYPLLASASRLDVIDGHVYWQHPHYLTDPKTGKRTGFSIPNTPMVNDPAKSTAVQLARSAVLGKPYTVSEANHPFPAEHAAEGVPVLTAYALLHDWDGIFWYTLAHDELVGQNPRPLQFFDYAPDPVKMSQLAAGALTFLRGDVKAAKETVLRAYTAEQVIDGIKAPWKEGPMFTPGFAPELALVHATRITAFDAKATPTYPAGPGVAGEIVSDTGQIRWAGAAAKKGTVTVETPRSQALVGYLKGAARGTSNLAADPETDFCALTLTSLDDAPIARAPRLLLTAGGRVANTGQAWNDKRTTLEKWGTAPARVEPVAGTVTLRGLDGAAGVSLQPLDGAGRSLGQPTEASRAGDGWRIKLGGPTVWWAITVRR